MQMYGVILFYIIGIIDNKQAFKYYFILHYYIALLIWIKENT